MSVRDRGQWLHVRAQLCGNDLLLSCTQLRVLCSHTGHRAVVLTNLHSPSRVGNRGRETVRIQHIGQFTHRIRQGFFIPRLHVGVKIDAGEQTVPVGRSEPLHGGATPCLPDCVKRVGC